MNQHINSMLEHLSSFRRKNSENAPPTSSDRTETDHRELNNDLEKLNGKPRNNIFKNLISDNGATNIFHNLIKCPDNISSHLTAMTSSPNGNCKPKLNEHSDDDNNNQQAVAALTVIPPAGDESVTNGIYKKRNSTVKMLQNSNGDLNFPQRELSPSLRTHRKSSHDIRLLRNNQMLPENGDMTETGKLAAVKPLKTKNIITKNETFDTLHCRAMEVSLSFHYSLSNSYSFT